MRDSYPLRTALAKSTEMREAFRAPERSVLRPPDNEHRWGAPPGEPRPTMHLAPLAVPEVGTVGRGCVSNC